MRVDVAVADDVEVLVLLAVAVGEGIAVSDGVGDGDIVTVPEAENTATRLKFTANGFRCVCMHGGTDPDMTHETLKGTATALTPIRRPAVHSVCCCQWSANSCTALQHSVLNSSLTSS